MEELSVNNVEPGTYVIEYYWRSHKPGPVTADFDGKTWRFHYGENRIIRKDQIESITRKVENLK